MNDLDVFWEQLVEAKLRHPRPPPLAFVLRWGLRADGTDPVALAWNENDRASLMFCVLDVFDPSERTSELAGDFLRSRERWASCDFHVMRWSGLHCPRCAVALRHALPAVTWPMVARALGLEVHPPIQTLPPEAPP
jgi:hypothetical protein